MATTARSDMSSSVERSLRSLFKRCVQCPAQTPSCTTTCPDGQLCSLVPPSCHKCAHTTCIKNPTPAPASSGPNVGAIAGGVLGGIAFISIIVFLIWWFWIKKRREEQDAELEEEWANDEIASQKRSTQFTAMLQDGAESTRTRGSLANSILSRASNIIQIAYIPGVTNRSGSSSSIHGPVPPVPAAHRSQPPRSPLSHDGDALFFRPGDLRDSTWSAASSVASSTDRRDTRYNNRDTQYTMASISPSLLRDSVASEAFMDAATVPPVPATAATVLAPRMVSVKSKNSSISLTGSTSSGNPSTPEENTGGKVKQLQVMMPGQTTTSPGVSPQPSIRSAGKAKQVTIPSRENSIKGRFPVRQTSDSSLSTTKHAPSVSSPLAEKDEEASTENEGASARLLSPLDSPQPVESPFFDASELWTTTGWTTPPASNAPPKPNPYASLASSIRTSTDGPPRRGKSIAGLGGLTAVIEEEARKRASGSEAGKEESPFGDEHATE